MKINKTYKIELKPNKCQLTLLRKAAGSARFTYNWGLSYKSEHYKSTKQNLTDKDLHKILCSLKKAEYPWMYEVSKCAPQEALTDLNNAFIRFFNKQAKYPKFKSRHKSKRSFRISFGHYFTHTTVHIPMIGKVILKEHERLPLGEIGVKFLSASFIEDAPDRWWVCVFSEEEYNDLPTQLNEVIGVDVGIKDLAVCSDGTVIENPHSYYKKEAKIKRLQSVVSRRAKGSTNRKRAVTRLAKTHFKAKCIRKDAISKFTSALVKTKPVVIVIEDLSVKNMLKNHKLSKHISDSAFGEIRRQIEYKAKWYGSEVIIADRFYPSTKKCSICGNSKSSLSLGERVYKCDVCGASIPRDLNAAVNLREYGVKHLSSTVRSTGSYACGERRLQGPAAPMGQVASAVQRSKKKTSNVKFE